MTPGFTAFVLLLFFHTANAKSLADCLIDVQNGVSCTIGPGFHTFPAGLYPTGVNIRERGEQNSPNLAFGLSGTVSQDEESAHQTVIAGVTHLAPLSWAKCSATAFGGRCQDAENTWVADIDGNQFGEVVQLW